MEQFAQFRKEANLTLAEVSHHHILEFLAHIGGSQLPSSRARKLAALRGFFQYLVDENFIRRDPAADLESPKLSMTLPDVLSPEEVDKLLSAPGMSKHTDCRDRAMLEVLYGAGLRVSELVQLNMGDVDPLGYVRCLGKGDKSALCPWEGGSCGGGGLCGKIPAQDGEEPPRNCVVCQRLGQPPDAPGGGRS